MTYQDIDGVLWFIIALLPFLVIQRWLHRELQTVLLIITRRIDIALTIFVLLFFPGVLLHELSHLTIALLLLVKVVRFSIFPKRLSNGKLQLGFVETAKTDVIRSSLIGSAPLIIGCAVVAYLGMNQLGFSKLVNVIGVESGSITQFVSILISLPRQPDFFIWFYLTFVISSTMLPSASDRSSWLPVALLIVLFILLSVIAGAGPWILVYITPTINQILKILAIVFGISLVLHLVLLIPLKIVKQLLLKIS